MFASKLKSSSLISKLCMNDNRRTQTKTVPLSMIWKLSNNNEHKI